MSLFCNGVVAHRNSRVRSLGGDHLPGQSNHDSDDRIFHLNNPDYHKSSLLSTSTKSTTLDSPPPRSVSFPANLPGRERTESGIENNAFHKDYEDNGDKMANGSAKRSFSAGSRYKRNGGIHPMSAPRVTITAEVPNEDVFQEETENGTNNNSTSEHKLHIPSSDNDEKPDCPVTSSNNALKIAEG